MAPRRPPPPGEGGGERGAKNGPQRAYTGQRRRGLRAGRPPSKPPSPDYCLLPTLTITDALFAASCNVLLDRCAYLMVTLGSECPRICWTS